MTAVLQQLEEPHLVPAPPRRGVPSRGAVAGTVVVLVLLGLAYHYAEVSPGALVKGYRGLVSFVGDALPPDLSWSKTVHPGLSALLVTFGIGTMATFLSLPFSFLLALAGSRTTNPNVPTFQAARAIMSVLRSVPTIVMGLIFLTAVGLGPFSATLGLAVHSSGITSKLWAEAMDEMDHGAVEAVRATGASRWQVLLHAILPSIAPTFVGLTLYRLDVNVREAVALGVIGAGGIGLLVDQSINEFRFDQVSTYVVLVLALVIGVDQLSTYVRKRLSL